MRGILDHLNWGNARLDIELCFINVLPNLSETASICPRVRTFFLQVDRTVAARTEKIPLELQWHIQNDPTCLQCSSAAELGLAGKVLPVLLYHLRNGKTKLESAGERQ